MSHRVDRQPQEILLGRQPILDRREDLVGFELLFRGRSSADGVVGSHSASTAAVILNAFSEFGLQRVLGRHKGYLNLTADDLMSDMTELLPKDQVVLEVLETVQVDDEIVRRCTELSRMGFSLALDDVIDVDALDARLLAIVDVVKLDVLAIGDERLPDIVGRLKRQGLSVLAEKVEARAQFDRGLELGCDLFQGYYFARPQLLTGKRVAPSTVGLLRLLSLLARDSDPTAVEEEIKGQPHLAYNLLRVANSVVLGLPQRIGSVRHCILMLGRRQIQRWVQLLVYNSGGSDRASGRPLMHLAATRGKLMELIAARQRPGDAEHREAAFVTGILSLLDTLLDVPFAQIVEPLNLEDHVREALLSRAGTIGRLLALVERLEGGDEDLIQSAIAQVGGIARFDLTQAEVEAIAWANTVCEPN